MNSNKTKKIYCGVLSRIEIEESVIQDLIFTKEFQRLNKIKQLGLMHYLFPGATHTRYMHSLGVYELSRRFLIELSKNHEISLKEKQIIMVAALLHDLGHGPLSHFFESINLKKHEEYTIEIIQSSSTEINQILIKHFTSKEIDLIIKIIKKEHKLKWVNQLISSEVDVDRLDYLLRDSFYTGTKYGNIDFEWIISNVGIEDETLYFRKESLESIESVLLGRYHMYTRVYYNSKIQAFSEQFKYLIKRIKDLKQINYQFKTNLERISSLLDQQAVALNEFLSLNDDTISVLILDLNNEDDLILKKLTNNILRGKIPEIYNFENIKELELFQNKTSKLNPDYDFSQLTLKEDFFYFINQAEEPKIMLNNQLLNLSEVSVLFKSSEHFNKISKKHQKLGVIF